MTASPTAPPLHRAPIQTSGPPEHIIHLARATDDRHPRAPRPPATTDTGHAGYHAADPSGSPDVRSWPLLLLALPAAVAVWSGWVGIGQMTGFGQVHPLPGLWPAFHLNTAITLPIGVEAYAAYALRAWLSTSTTISTRTRTFARWSAIASLLLGMAGQVAYHLLSQAHTARAPWAVTMAVSCLPVLVLGMGAALTHLLHADAHTPGALVRRTVPGPDQAQDQSEHHSPGKDHAAATIRPGRLAQAEAAAHRIQAAGRRVSRRNLRAAGVRASNAELGKLAIRFATHPPG